MKRAELDQRSAERALTFRNRPTREQHQLIATWTDHRARWGLPHHQRGTSTRRRARSSRSLEDALLQLQHPIVKDLVLLDHAAQTHPQHRREDVATATRYYGSTRPKGGS